MLSILSIRLRIPLDSTLSTFQRFSLQYLILLLYYAWLKFVQTGKAKSHIKRWVKKEQTEQSTRLGREILEKTLRRMKRLNILEEIMKAKAPWGRVVNSVRENFAWDFEEATAITIAKNKAQFYDEIRDYLANHLKVDLEEAVLADLFKYQIDAVLDPVKSYPSEHSYHYNIHEVIKFNDELKLEA